MTLELAILIPALLAFIALLTLAGRIALAGNTVTQVAHEAARAASIERTATAAHTIAYSTALASLEAQGIRCEALDVAVNTAGFATAPGAPSAVTIDVSCTVPLADLALPGLPGTRTLTGSASSAIDTFREVG